MTDIISLGESQSRIEDKNDSLNSSSSFRSLNSFIDLLSKNKTTEDPSVVLLNNNNMNIPPLPLHASISRNILTRNVLKNPYISPNIKMKMNEIIADNNIDQTTFNRYQLYSNNKCFTRKASIDTTNSARKSAYKPYALKSFTFAGSTSTAISTSMQKINQIRQYIGKANSSIVHMSSANSCRNNMNTSNHVMNTFRQTNNAIVSLKKQFIDKNHNVNDLNSLKLDKRKVTPFSTKNNDFIKANYIQLLNNSKYTPRLFM